MKIRYKYRVGRFVNPSTGRPVNIHAGQRRDNGCDVYYFVYRFKRIFVGEEFRSWRKIGGGP